MEFQEIIKKRRSCRSFDANAAVAKEDLYEILTEMQQAPSWKNLQGGRCYVAASKEAVEAVYNTLPSFNKDSTAGCRYYLVTTYVKGQSGSELWGAYDLGLQNAYLCMAATNHGFDTLIMGLRDDNALREYFNIPREETIMAVIALGKASGELPGKERLPLEKVVKEK